MIVVADQSEQPNTKSAKIENFGWNKSKSHSNKAMKYVKKSCYATRLGYWTIVSIPNAPKFEELFVLGCLCLVYVWFHLHFGIGLLYSSFLNRILSGYLSSLGARASMTSTTNTIANDQCNSRLNVN